MILKSLKLHNIRSYHDEMIMFPEGIVLLSGDIGAGKSTILHAVEFALFGFIRGSVDGESLLRKGKHEGSVELAAEIDKKSVIIHRTIRRGNSVKQEHGFLIIEDVKIDATPVELKAKMLELLGYSEDLLSKTKDLIYRYTVYTPQEEMKRILLESKEARLETLRKVFNLEKYKKIRENTFTIVKQLKLHRAYFEGLVQDIPQKQNTLNEYHARLKELTANSEQLIPLLSFVKDELQDKKTQIEQQKQQVQEYYSHKQALAVEETRLKNLHEVKEKASSDLQSIEVKKKSLLKELETLSLEKPTTLSREEIEKEIQVLDEQHEAYKEQKFRHQQEYQYHQKLINQLSQDIEQKKIQLTGFALKKTSLEQLQGCEEKIVFLKDEITCLEQNNLVLTGYIKEHEITIDNAANIKEKITALNKCPTCLQEVNQEHKTQVYQLKESEMHEAQYHLMRMSAERKAGEQQLKKIRQEYEQMLAQQREKEKLEIEIRGLSNIEEEILNKQKLLEKTKEVTAYLTQQEEQLTQFDEQESLKKRAQYKSLLISLQKYNEVAQRKHMKQVMFDDLFKQEEILLKNITRTANQLEVTKNNIIVLSNQVQKLKESELTYQKLEQELEQLHLREKQLYGEKTKIETEQNNVLELQQRLEQELDQKLLYKKKITTINQYINWLQKFFVNVTYVIEKHIMLQVYHEFNRIFIDWFRLLLDDEILSVRLDEEFSPVIEQNGYEVDITSISGGERTAVCLAYRLALNKVINEFMTSITTKDILILDEPTEGFSHEQLDKLKDVLDELLIKQVIIVSHEAKIESFVDTVIRIEKTEHVSQVVRSS